MFKKLSWILFFIFLEGILQRADLCASLQDDEVLTCPECRLNQACFHYERITLGREEGDFASLRQTFMDLLNDPGAGEPVKASARYQLAFMDYLGHAQEKPDPDQAWSTFVFLRRHYWASPCVKKKASSMIAVMIVKGYRPAGLGDTDLYEIITYLKEKQVCNPVVMPAIETYLARFAPLQESQLSCARTRPLPKALFPQDASSGAGF